MTQNKRLHRPEPERTKPIRNRTAYLRKSVSWGEMGPDDDFDAEELSGITNQCDDILTHGVNLGYKIIDEHILQGKQIAENLKNRSRFRENKSSEIGELNALVNRLLGLTKDMGALCMDSVELALKTPRILTHGLHSQVSDEPKTAKHSHSTGTQFSLEISSVKKTQVSLNLSARLPASRLYIHVLHASDPALAPLKGASFKHQEAHAPLILAIEVPSNQAAATYTGVVVDQQTNEPVGTLVVKVLS